MMLTALYGQLELGDCGDVLLDYTDTAAQFLAPRLAPTIRNGKNFHLIVCFRVWWVLPFFLSSPIKSSFPYEP